MSNIKTSIEHPSVLSFERKLEVSDAKMFSGNWEQDKSSSWDPILITKRFNRSTQSAHGIPDTKKIAPNLASSGNDDANLPEGKDTLKISFSMRILGNLGEPFSCNDPNFEKKIIKKVEDFKTKGDGLNTLAYRYAYNIANGRFLWRNRVGAESIKIYIDGEEKFDSYKFDMKNFEKNKNDKNLEDLTQIIKRGLTGDSDFVFLKIDAFSKLGNSQHVFPSQEMNTDQKEKKLFHLNHCAAIHNVKIGNALRTIDDWFVDSVSPIAIEPYGAVTQKGVAYRKSGNDLYTLMIKWVNDETTISKDDENFIVSNLIRGGVFSKVSKN